MTDQKKIAIMDNLLKEARDPQWKTLATVMVDPNRRFRVCELLVEDGEDKYWISIEYNDR